MSKPVVCEVKFFAQNGAGNRVGYYVSRCVLGQVWLGPGLRVREGAYDFMSTRHAINLNILRETSGWSSGWL